MSSKQTLVQHLAELRSCLIRSIVGLAAGTLLSLYFSKEIFHFLQKPMLWAMPAGTGFIATGPLEAVSTYFKVSLLAGVFLSAPYLLYQVWRFIAPGLYAKEKKLALAFVASSSLLFIGGAIFGYYVIFPVGFKFFVSILAGTEIRFLPQMKDYLGFISKMLLVFGVVFEMPLLLVAVSRMGLVSLETLRKTRRYVLVLAFLIAGLLTPGPDILSQTLLALPLLGLYEISLLLIWMTQKKGDSPCA